MYTFEDTSNCHFPEMLALDGAEVVSFSIDCVTCIREKAHFRSFECDVQQWCPIGDQCLSMKNF